MSQDLITLLLSVVVALFVLGGIFGLAYLKKHNKLTPVVGQIADAIPTVLELAQNIVTKGDAKNPANKTFEVLQGIAEAAAKSVEQVSKTETLESAQKLALAKENFESVAKGVGIDPSELDEKVVEALIENVVYHLGK
jgi:hypothetical protein